MTHGKFHKGPFFCMAQIRLPLWMCAEVRPLIPGTGCLYEATKWESSNDGGEFRDAVFGTFRNFWAWKMRDAPKPFLYKGGFGNQVFLGFWVKQFSNEGLSKNSLSKTTRWAMSGRQGFLKMYFLILNEERLRSPESSKSQGRKEWVWFGDRKFFAEFWWLLNFGVQSSFTPKVFGADSISAILTYMRFFNSVVIWSTILGHVFSDVDDSFG